MISVGAPIDAPFEVSIALLCWRDSAFIAQAIDAALAQTVPCEIVISNDCSDDDTYERACAHVAGYTGPHTVRVRRTARNLGVAAHVNNVIPLTHGRIVVMMAGDDIAHPQRVARTLAAFHANPDVMALATQVEGIDTDGAPVYVDLPLRRERFGLDYFVSSGRLMGLLGASLAFRREVFDRFGPLRGPIEDNALSLRAALLGECLKLREPLVRYRQHSGSVSSGVFAKNEPKAVARRRRYERTIRFYRGTADDLEHCIGLMPELQGARLRDALDVLRMYRLEADAREALLDAPRTQWLRPILHGLAQRGLRRKSAERLIKLVLPRRYAAG